MDTKKLLVSFCAVAIALFLVMTVSAIGSTGDLALQDSVEVEVNGVDVNLTPAIIAGETITVKVVFKAETDASEVTIKVELDDATAETAKFDVIDGKTYKRTLTLEVPYELKDETFDEVKLEITIEGEDKEGNNVEEEVSNITLTVQRPSYNAKVMSVTTEQRVEAGEIVPVNVVLKNTGYNELDDMYVTLRIAELDVEKSAYFGDVVAVEDEDNDDVVSGKFYLKIPYEAQAGVYTLEVEATNDDLSITRFKQLTVDNDFPENVLATSTHKLVSVGEKAEYTLMLVNPTNKLKVYRIVTDSNCEVCNLFSSVNTAVVAVPAGLSKTVTVTASAKTEGEYMFNVNVFSGEELESVVSLSLTAEGKKTNPVAVLTIILAIIFLVLLVVLIVLLGKKPKKDEELGESYY